MFQVNYAVSLVDSSELTMMCALEYIGVCWV